MKFNLDAIRSGVPIREALKKLPQIPTASAISGLIVAALILMTPNPWFEAFIVETGLPSLVAAAEPPLGARARIVFALAAALIVTCCAWAVLSFIVGRKRQSIEEAGEYESDFDLAAERPDVKTGSLRSADAHPDAPYRRPIMAEDDLGPPLDHVDVELGEAESTETEEQPLDLAAFGQVAPDYEAEDGNAIAEQQAETLADSVGEPKTDADEVTASEPVEPVFEIPLPRRDTVEDDIPDKEPVVADTSVGAGLPVDRRTELARLVDRLEAGLERKRAREQAAAQNVSETVPQSGRDRDAALREALNALQQVTAKSG